MEENQSRMWRSTGNGRSYKTQLCRKFMHGTCNLGHNCNYAHGVSDLRRTTNHGGGNRQEPKLCRLFSLHGQCSYGHNCRFLHSSTPSQSQLHHHQQSNKNPPFHPLAHAHAQGQPQADAGEKLDGKTSTNPTNASTSSTVATSSLPKNEDPYKVKFPFKENKLNRIIGIYGDWI